MRFLLGMGILIFSQFLAATTFHTQIHRVETSYRPDEESLIYLKNGRVAKLSSENTKLLEQIVVSQNHQSWLNVTVDADRMISNITAAASPVSAPKSFHKSFFIAEEEYVPSVITSLEEAKALHRDHRLAKEGETQCFNRAHVWSYDWRAKKNIYSNKIWVFFTAKYIRKYNFEWWFHVAPMIHVNIDGKIKERVMDMKYATSGPKTTKAWTDIFLKDDALCPTVTKYSDHADYPESGSCFLQKSSMYFYQPVDLENLEKFGTTKPAWLAADVTTAYLEAFGIIP